MSAPFSKSVRARFFSTAGNALFFFKICSRYEAHETFALVEFAELSWEEEDSMIGGVVSGVSNFGASLHMFLDDELAGGAGFINARRVNLDIRSILDDEDR